MKLRTVRAVLYFSATAQRDHTYMYLTCTVSTTPFHSANKLPNNAERAERRHETESSTHESRDGVGETL